MAETQKTLAALLAENPDNTSGAITPEIIRNQIVSTFGRYAELQIVTNAVATTLTVQNTWYQIDKFDVNGLFDGATPDFTNDHITILADGTYEATFSCSYSGTGNQTYEVSIRINNGATLVSNANRSRRLGTGGDVGAITAAGIEALTAADTVEVWARCTSGAGNNITVANGTLYIRQVSGV